MNHVPITKDMIELTSASGLDGLDRKALCVTPVYYEVENDRLGFAFVHSMGSLHILLYQ